MKKHKKRNTTAERTFVCLYLQQTRESWQVVFSITAGMFTLGGVMFCVLGSGVIQPWARRDQPTSTAAADLPLRAPHTDQATRARTVDRHDAVVSEY